MDEQFITISAMVEAIIFRNDLNGYTVARASLPNGEDIVLVGAMPLLGVGESIEAQGERKNHPQHGEQFSVLSYTSFMPEDSEGIYHYLASRSVKGIGPKTARAIVDRFGAQTFEVLSGDPKKLAEIKGITLKKAREICDNFQSMSAMRTLLAFLTQSGLPLHIAGMLLRDYGTAAEQAIRSDPYLLCRGDYGMGFYEVDELARALDISEDSPSRIDGALLFELAFNMQNGHTFLPEDKLISATDDLIGCGESLLFERIGELCKKGRIVPDTIGKTQVYYLDFLYTQELFLADEIFRLYSMTLKPPPNLEGLISKIERRREIEYVPLQRQALSMCFSSAISLITGGPGTGKTTALITLVEILEACGLETVLAAPTGRAAKRMSELCGREARTIHRLLEAAAGNGGAMHFRRNRENPLSADVIIVDEASMIDNALAAALLDALKPHTRLVLVGDVDQLPPVGSGSFFSDLLDCPSLPRVALTEIFRQARESDIVVAAHEINSGTVPALRKNDNDFYFTAGRSAEGTVDNVISLITTRIPSHFGIASEDIQVICPTRMTPCGTASLNKLLQAVLNPPSKLKAEARLPDRILRVGDRVMQIKNNYDLIWVRQKTAEVGTGVFNGDSGVIDSIDNQSRLMTVRFEDRLCEYSFDNISELEHGWAITAHKSQGSEYPAVIIPLFSVPSRLLSRNILYTAVTRARSLLILVGRAELVGEMIKAGKKNRRFSGLRRRLKDMVGDD